MYNMTNIAKFYNKFLSLNRPDPLVFVHFLTRPNPTRPAGPSDPRATLVTSSVNSLQVTLLIEDGTLYYKIMNLNLNINYGVAQGSVLGPYIIISYLRK